MMKRPVYTTTIKKNREEKHSEGKRMMDYANEYCIFIKTRLLFVKSVKYNHQY